MNIQFFANRTLAREAAKAAGVKPVDNGKDSAPGKRWSIEVPPATQIAFNETAKARSEWQKNKAPAVNVSLSVESSAPGPAPSPEKRRDPLSLSFPTGKRFPGKRRQRVTTVTGKAGNQIPVTWRNRAIHQIAA